MARAFNHNNPLRILANQSISRSDASVGANYLENIDLPESSMSSSISRREDHLSQSPILKAFSSTQRSGARVLLMGGQACIFYGASEFSRDWRMRHTCQSWCEHSAPLTPK